MADEVPPRELIGLASGTGVIVSSSTARAVESATALAPGRTIVRSSLLVELELSPPQIAGIRMPLLGWALAIGFAALVRAVHRQPPLAAAERERIDAAAAWLEQLAQEHGSVMAVTHYSFRNQLVPHLMQRGWHHDPPPRRSRHWSASSLSRQDGPA